MKQQDLQLQAYLDNELSSGDRAAMEQLLEQDPGMQRQLEALKALSAELASLPAVEVMPVEPVLQNVQREVRLSQTAPASRPAWKWAWAPAAAAAMIWGAVSLLPFSSVPLPASVIVEQIEVQSDATVPLVYTDQDSGWTVVWLSNSTAQEEYAPL